MKRYDVVRSPGPVDGSLYTQPIKSIKLQESVGSPLLPIVRSNQAERVPQQTDVGQVKEVTELPPPENRSYDIVEKKYQSIRVDNAEINEGEASGVASSNSASMQVEVDDKNWNKDDVCGETRNTQNELVETNFCTAEETQEYTDDSLKHNITSGILFLKPEVDDGKRKSCLSKSFSLPNINDPEMYTQANSHLTQEQIHEAMLLINECISDQQSRSESKPPVSPYDTNYSVFNEAILRSPVKLNRFWQSKRRKSSEDLVANNENDDQNNNSALDFSWCDDILDNVIAELTGKSVISYDGDASESLTNRKNSSSSRYKSSFDSGHYFDFHARPTFDSCQKRSSSSDLDSGIEESALATSLSNEVRIGNHEKKQDNGFSSQSCSFEKNNSNISQATKSQSNDGFSKQNSFKFGHENPEEDEEERVVREEIEKTTKHLAKLHHQQNQLKEQRMKPKNHPNLVYVLYPENSISISEQSYAVKQKSPEHSPYHNMKRIEMNDAVLKSDCEVNSKTEMLSTAFPVESSKKYTHFGRNSPGVQTQDSSMSERANLFTPAYAHPMHHPERMIITDYSSKKQKKEHNGKEELKIPVQKHNQWTEKIELKNPASISPMNNDIEKTKSCIEQSSEISVATKSPINSDDLQLQLDELDQYIAELTEDRFTNASNKTLKRSVSCTSSDVSRTKRLSYQPKSLEIADVPNKSTNVPNISPPMPPSRDQSSFNSVSRRLPATSSFNSTHVTTNNSSDQNFPKNETVITSSGQSKLPYVPQANTKRPPQLQLSSQAQTNTFKTPPRKNNKLEDRLSPQLFIAMSVNPGGRPVEEIHSYKEDLDPSFGIDVVDSAVSSTPGFPVTPQTPYVNDKSPLSGNFPVGFVQTPLSALGLKHNPNPDPIEEVEEENEGFHDVAKQVRSPPLTYSSNVSHVGTQASPRLQQQTSPPAYNQDLSTSYNSKVHTPISSLPKTRLNLLSNNSHDSGFAESHPVSLSSGNGWNPSDQSSNQENISNGYHQQQGELQKTFDPILTHQRSLSNEGAASQRNFSGSNDSLLSDGVSSNHSYRAQQKLTVQPALPPKESSLRNSGHSFRSTSTGSGLMISQSCTNATEFPSPNNFSNQGVVSQSTSIQKRESQMSSYDKQGSHRPHRITNSPNDWENNSIRSSSSSLSEIEKLASDLQAGLYSPTPKFIKDTTPFWYKPDISREQALAMLRDRPAGYFVVRNSRCYPGAFGLALKVNEIPAAVLSAVKPGTNLTDELVRHFLIEPNSRGVKLKGNPNEPVFGSLSALIYQHSITPISLPCKLIIPTENQEVPQVNGSGLSVGISNTAAELLRQGAACNVIYLGSVDTESLTGPDAIDRSINECLQDGEKSVKTSVVHFKVSSQGITLTDNARKIFFRRHYPTASVNFCGLDPSAREPKNRRWNATNDRGPPDARIFGFVAKKQGGPVGNACHLFAELDLDQPAQAITNFVSKILIGSG